MNHKINWVEKVKNLFFQEFYEERLGDTQITVVLYIYLI